VDGFIDHFTTRLGSTSNYSATTNLSQLTNHHSTCNVYTSPSLATASNSGYSSVSGAHVVTARRIGRNSTIHCPAYNISPRTTYKTPHFHCYTPSFALLRLCCLAMGTCSPSRCIETLWYICLSHGHCIATAIHATILTFFNFLT
jgi:hypothetical protein